MVVGSINLQRALVESMLAVDAEGLEPEGAKIELMIMGSDWFCEAVHDTIAAIMEDQPHTDQVINGLESDHWREAIEAQLTQIKKLGTWEVIEAPPGINIIDSHFVLCWKCNAQGNNSRYKAHLIAKAFKQ